jgi:hypothetical protein
VEQLEKRDIHQVFDVQQSAQDNLNLKLARAEEHQNPLGFRFELDIYVTASKRTKL